MNRIESKLTETSERLEKALGIKTFAIFSTSLTLLFYIYSFMYSINCQNLYGIPAKYFNITIRNIIPYVLPLFLIVVALIYYYHFSKNNNFENTLLRKIYCLWNAFVPGLVFSIIEFTLFYIFLLKYNWNANFLNSFSVTAIYISMLIFSIVSFVKIPENTPNSTPKYLKFKKAIKKVSLSFSIILYTAIIISYVFLFFNATPINASCETTVINNKNYVILSEYDGDYLVVEYDDTNDTTVFFTSEYQLVDKEALNIKVLSFSNIEYK